MFSSPVHQQARRVGRISLANGGPARTPGTTLRHLKHRRPEAGGRLGVGVLSRKAGKDFSLFVG